MISPFQIYLITRADNVKGLVLIAAILGFLAVGVFIITMLLYAESAQVC